MIKESFFVIFFGMSSLLYGFDSEPFFQAAEKKNWEEQMDCFSLEQESSTFQEVEENVEKILQVFNARYYPEGEEGLEVRFHFLLFFCYHKYDENIIPMLNEKYGFSKNRKRGLDLQTLFIYSAVFLERWGPKDPTASKVFEDPTIQNYWDYFCHRESCSSCKSFSFYEPKASTVIPQKFVVCFYKAVLSTCLAWLQEERRKVGSSTSLLKSACYDFRCACEKD